MTVTLVWFLYVYFLFTCVTHTVSCWLYLNFTMQRHSSTLFLIHAYLVTLKQLEHSNYSLHDLASFPFLVFWMFIAYWSKLYSCSITISFSHSYSWGGIFICSYKSSFKRLKESRRLTRKAGRRGLLVFRQGCRRRILLSTSLSLLLASLWPLSTRNSSSNLRTLFG